MSKAILRIHFEDDGQDFLSWDVDLFGNVVDCTPFQKDVWTKAVITDPVLSIKPKQNIWLAFQGEVFELKHKVLRVEFINKDYKMNTIIQIEIANRRSIINIKGTPEEVAQALMQTAAQNDTLKSALGILTAVIKSEIKECDCGKLSKTECQMSYISEFATKKTAAEVPDLRLKDGVDEGAYADD